MQVKDLYNEKYKMLKKILKHGKAARLNDIKCEK
jgi:hypothetical protein